MAYMVPRVLATTPDEMTGIARVQLTLLVPHVLSVVCGLLLTRANLPAATLDAGTPSDVRRQCADLEQTPPKVRVPPAMPARSPVAASAVARLLGLSSGDDIIEGEPMEGSLASSVDHRLMVIALLNGP